MVHQFDLKFLGHVCCCCVHGPYKYLWNLMIFRHCISYYVSSVLAQNSYLHFLKFHKTRRFYLIDLKFIGNTEISLGNPFVRKPRRVNPEIYFKSRNIFQIQKYISNPEIYFKSRKYISNPEIYFKSGNIFQIRKYISNPEIYFRSGNIFQIRKYISDPEIYFKSGNIFQIRKYISDPEIYFKSGNIFQIQKYISNPEIYFKSRNIFQIRKYISNPEIISNPQSLSIA